MQSWEEFLQLGIEAVKEGRLDEGRRYLAQSIKLNPNNEQAWIWMSGVVEDNQHRIDCLMRVLQINPENAMAIKGLTALGAYTPPQESGDLPIDSIEEIPVEEELLPELDTAPSAVPAPPAELTYSRPKRPRPSAPDGIPLINSDVIKDAQREADDVLEQLYQKEQASTISLTWVKPEKAPAGRVPFYRNPMIIAAGGSIIIVVLVIVLVSSIGNLIRGTSRPAAPVENGDDGGAGPTSAASPTITVTPQPTRTPTPQGNPITPTPEFDSNGVPHSDLSFGMPPPTQPYINTPHPSVLDLQDALIAYYERRYQETIDLADEVLEENEEPPVDTYYFKGMALYQLGEYEEARDAFEEGIDVDPNFAPLHVGLGLIHYRDERFQQAALEFEQAIEFDPELLDAYLGLVQIYLDEGEYEQALEEMTAVKERRNYRFDVNALVMEGRVLLAMGRNRDAVELGNYAYYIDPSAREVVMFLARARLATELYASAMFGLEEYLEDLNPFDSEAWMLLARAYQNQGRTQDAFNAYGRALQLASDDDTEIYIGRGLLYFDLGQYDLAYEDLSRALERSPNNYEARYGRAISAFAMSDFESALEDIEFVREFESDDPEIEVLYVQMLIMDEQYDEALDAADHTLSLDITEEQRGFMLEARARAHYEDGNYNAAFVDITNALEIESTGTRHYYKALIMGALGDRSVAIFELEWVLFWSQTYQYPFEDDARELWEDLVAERDAELNGGAATPTPSPTATDEPSPAPTEEATPTP